MFCTSSSNSLAAIHRAVVPTAWKEPVLFNKKQLEDLANGLADDPPIYFDRNKVIVEEGQTGTRMYVVLKGRVLVYLDGEVVEKIGPGGVFGELALVDQPTRLASVVAETDCELLPIGRPAGGNLQECAGPRAADPRPD